MQFSSRSIELLFKAIFELFSRRKSLLYFFPGAFNIKLVNSFILVWHSDYELSSKTQKPFFILKESSKCHNIINYRAKNHVVMFCLGLQSIARFINTNASYFNTRRLESNLTYNTWQRACRYPRGLQILIGAGKFSRGYDHYKILCKLGSGYGYALTCLSGLWIEFTFEFFFFWKIRKTWLFFGLTIKRL